jgi:hypothetical protein
MKTPMKKIVVLTLLTSLVSGCATTGQSGMSQTQYPQGGVAAEQDPCAVGSSALMGAAAGALLGALMDGKRGAARGAAFAALGCVAINSQSRQTRTAAQVDNDFIRTRGRLPAEPQVVSYQPRLNASTVQRGKPVVVTSTVELVNGATTPVMQVREELVVFDQDGKQFKSGSKALTNNSGGRFENSFEITLPKDASQGRYALRTNLYVNGKLSASRDLNTQLVWNGAEQVMIASR